MSLARHLILLVSRPRSSENLWRCPTATLGFGSSVPEVEGAVPRSTADVYDDGLNKWIPQTRNPAYLWLYYSGSGRRIPSDEQRSLAGLDLWTLRVPPRLTAESLQDWIRVSIQASPFMNSVRQFGNRTDQAVWDSVAEEWGVSRSTSARWVATAQNWLRYFYSGTSHASDAGTQEPENFRLRRPVPCGSGS